MTSAAWNPWRRISAGTVNRSLLQIRLPAPGGWAFCPAGHRRRFRSQLLHPLRELGVTIALDDFGTSCSALSRIGELPIDCIKIDKGFIDNMIFKAKHRLIIKDLISMCHKLGLRVVAEGVEQETQRRDLLESGCVVMQGYLYSKLLLEEEALAKLA
ncbi:MAG: EAL domain-containing protein [Limnochordia bacterium]